jgi:hypothetical protein
MAQNLDEQKKLELLLLCCLQAPMLVAAALVSDSAACGLADASRPPASPRRLQCGAFRGHLRRHTPGRIRAGLAFTLIEGLVSYN